MGSGGAAGSGGTPGLPDPAVCGDGIRDPVDEECDDGNTSDSACALDLADCDSCDDSCKVLDVLVVPQDAPDGGPPNPGRVLGDGRHPVASGDSGFAVAFIQRDVTPPAVSLTTFDEDGVPSGIVNTFSVGTTPVLFANPVLAALPGGDYAAAWNDLNGDGDALGVAIRRVDPAVFTTGVPSHANQTVDFSQYDPDILWTGTEVVVAWVDASALFTGPDILYRTFDEQLNPTSDEVSLAATVAREENVALATFDGGWAAAWRSSDGGDEDIEVVIPGTDSWTIGPLSGSRAEDRPAIDAIDTERLLLVFTEGSDPEDAGVENTPRLKAVLLDTTDTAAPAVVAVDALHPDYVGDDSIAQSHPNVISVQDRCYISWRTERRLGDELIEELWLKEVTLDTSGPGFALDLTAVEIPLPRQDNHVDGDQRRPALAATSLFPEGAIATAWDDFGRVFGEREGSPDVVVQLIPTPIVRFNPMAREYWPWR